MSDTPLHWWTARRLRDSLVAGDISAEEVMEAHLIRIEAVNGRVNAIVSGEPEPAMEEARALDRRWGRDRLGDRGRERERFERFGPLYGLPVAVKDLMDTAGMRTTYGSPIYRDHVPAADSLLVTRLRDAGAIVIGKTNTPEFGAGSHTFNDVFGHTHNPYALDRSAGGSSGGAAAALAAGMVPVADGSDLGGSVRNPASFCNVVGLRPSPGRVASRRPGDAWSPMSLLGPMARNVEDVGLLLTAIAGPDGLAPLSIDGDPEVFSRLEPLDLSGVRVAWSETVSGLPVDPQVTASLAGARVTLEALGAVVRDVEPELSDADEAYETLRALEFFAGHAGDVDQHPDLVKPEVREDVDRGRTLSAAAIVSALEVRTKIFRRTAALMSRYELLAMPTVQLPPFPVHWRYPEQVAGVAMERYYTWMRSCTRTTMTLHPALSLPAGFTPGGLPVGLQLVGRHRGELALLGYALTLERALDAGSRRPDL